MHVINNENQFGKDKPAAKDKNYGG